MKYLFRKVVDINPYPGYYLRYDSNDLIDEDEAMERIGRIMYGQVSTTKAFEILTAPPPKFDYDKKREEAEHALQILKELEKALICIASNNPD